MPPAPSAEVRRATAATYVAFIAAGVAFASWASRIPQVRDHLHLTPQRLGLVLFSIAVGSVLALPLAGPVIHRIGGRRTVQVGAVTLGLALAVVAVGYQYGVAPVVVGLFFVGLSIGSWDVSMNVQAALVEQAAGRALMPRFHAGYSIGTVAGAGAGAALVALHVPVTAHLLAVGLGIAVCVPLSVRGFLPDATQESAPGGRSSRGAWRERRTLVVGVFVLAFAFAEGTGNDWAAVALIDGYSVTPAVATAGFALFLAAMTGVRWVGPGLLDRFGRVRVVRSSAALSVGGVALFVFGHAAPVAFVGALLWGAGVALGFPVGMSAGADDPRRAAARLSVIASVGYCAFLAGPPLVGFLGQQTTVLHALTAVAALMAVASALAGAVAPLALHPVEDDVGGRRDAPVR